MNNYAGQLYSGNACTKNLEEAQKWYRKAAKIGNESAIKQLKEKFGENV